MQLSVKSTGKLNLYSFHNIHGCGKTGMSLNMILQGGIRVFWSTREGERGYSVNTYLISG